MKEQIFNVKNDEDSHLGEDKIPRRSSNMGHDVFKPYLRISKNLNIVVKHVTNSYSMKKNVEECLSLRVC
jgi:dimeric dUTPase (all-alpha-NTP-PPase superfamily)